MSGSILCLFNNMNLVIVNNCSHIHSNGILPCTASKPPVNSTGPIVNEAEIAQKLPPCFGINCTKYNDERYSGIV